MTFNETPLTYIFILRKSTRRRLTIIDSRIILPQASNYIFLPYKYTHVAFNFRLEGIIYYILTLECSVSPLRLHFDEI